MSKQVRLPDTFREIRMLNELPIGESAWLSHDALRISSTGRLYVHEETYVRPAASTEDDLTIRRIHEIYGSDVLVTKILSGSKPALIIDVANVQKKEWYWNERDNLSDKRLNRSDMYKVVGILNNGVDIGVAEEQQQRKSLWDRLVDWFFS